MRGSRRSLLERDAELRAIRRALQAARAGEGSTLLIEGPAGIGKTALIGAAAGAAERADMTVLRALGSELERQLPFGVVRELLEPPLRGAAAREELLGGAAGLCAPLFAGGEHAHDTGAGLLHGLYWLLCALAERGPLALLIDDAQWADRRSLDLLAFLAPRVDELPLALVVATRPRDGDAGAAQALGPGARRLLPEPLSPAAVERLIAAELGPPDPGFVAACREATGGSPFFARELVRALAADGIAPRDGSAALVRQLGPAGVARATLPRMARAAPGAVALGRALAVLGDGAETALVAELAGIDEAAAREAAAALTRAGILAGDRPPRFAHPIVRSSILGDLTPAERAAAHGRAAALLSARGAPATRVAGHLLEADPVGEPWAYDALAAAAREARSRGASAFAADCLRRALSEPLGDERAALLRALGELAFEAGQPDALEHLEAAWSEARGPRDRALAARALGVPLVGAGRVEEALERLLAASAALPAGDPLALGLLAGASSLALLAPMDLTARVMAEVDGQPPPGDAGGAEGVLLANVAYWRAMRGSGSEACAALARRALAGDALLSEEGPASPALHYAVLILISSDAFDEAERHLAAALERSRATGSVLGFALCSMMRSLSGYRRGALADAEADARQATDTARLHGFGPGLPAAVGFLVDALVERGELAEAGDALGEAGLAGPLPDDLLHNPVLVARGRLAIARGELAAGVEDLRELARRSESELARGTVGTPTWRSYAAPALVALGEREEALRLAEEELALAREWGAERSLGTALRVRGGVEEAGDALPWLEQAVAALEGTPALLEHGRALLELGAALRRLRRPRDAREPLRAALDLLARCGAAPLCERAAHELEATGARRRSRTLLTGVEALTPSERRIAAMAAEGMTNREIAEALFLTRKTIEMHLGGAYRKLGVTSREELPGALGGEKPRVGPRS